MQTWTMALIGWSAVGLISYVCVLCFLRPMPLVRRTLSPKEDVASAKPAPLLPIIVTLVGLPLAILFSPLVLLAWGWHRLRRGKSILSAPNEPKA